MRRLLGFLAFVAIVVVAFGFWRGWFTVNQAKIQHDTHKIEKKIERESEKLKGDVNSEAKKVEEKTSN